MNETVESSHVPLDGTVGHTGTPTGNNIRRVVKNVQKYNFLLLKDQKCCVDELIVLGEVKDVVPEPN
jgi:hypothetical protein